MTIKIDDTGTLSELLDRTFEYKPDFKNIVILVDEDYTEDQLDVIVKDIFNFTKEKFEDCVNVFDGLVDNEDKRGINIYKVCASSSSSEFSRRKLLQLASHVIRMSVRGHNRQKSITVVQGERLFYAKPDNTWGEYLMPYDLGLLIMASPMIRQDLDNPEHFIIASE